MMYEYKQEIINYVTNIYNALKSQILEKLPLPVVTSPSCFGNVCADSRNWKFRVNRNVSCNKVWYYVEVYYEFSSVRNIPIYDVNISEFATVFTNHLEIQKSFNIIHDGSIDLGINPDWFIISDDNDNKGNTSESSEHEVEEDKSEKIPDDRKTVQSDDYHLRFYLSEICIIQKALNAYSFTLPDLEVNPSYLKAISYVMSLINRAVLLSYDSVLFHVDIDPEVETDSDELPF